MTDFKHCRSCNTNKPVTDFWRAENHKDKLRSYCKPCTHKRNRVYTRKYEQSAKYQALIQSESYRARKREYQRLRVPLEAKRVISARTVAKKRLNGTWELYWKAHEFVKRAVQNQIIKKETCAICDDPDVQAHHEDYNEPLEVVWLCPYHHRNIEKIKATILPDLAA